MSLSQEGEGRLPLISVNTSALLREEKAQMFAQGGRNDYIMYSHTENTNTQTSFYVGNNLQRTFLIIFDTDV